MEFDLTKFRAIYPQFSEIADDSLLFMSQNALMIGGLPFPEFSDDENERLWFMLTCHLATLAMQKATGAVASATEGSVSVSFVPLPQANEEAAFFNQTPCGASFWQIVKGRKVGGRWFCG